MELPVNEKPPGCLIPRIFQGSSVAIVAGGPSLTGHDFSKFDGLNAIAVNRAHEFVPNATLLWWTDAGFWRNYRDHGENGAPGILAHAAKYKATGNIGYHAADNLAEGIHVYRFTGRDGFDPDPSCLRHGNNSAYAAMHLAAHLGAKRIVLFGVDMRFGPNGETHFHGGYGPQPEWDERKRKDRERIVTELMRPFFSSLQKPLAQMGIEVLNASPASALTIWPRMSIEEGLKCLTVTQPSIVKTKQSRAP